MIKNYIWKKKVSWGHVTKAIWGFLFCLKVRIILFLRKVFNIYVLQSLKHKEVHSWTNQIYLEEASNSAAANALLTLEMQMPFCSCFNQAMNACRCRPAPWVWCIKSQILWVENHNRHDGCLTMLYWRVTGVLLELMTQIALFKSSLVFHKLFILSSNICSSTKDSSSINFWGFFSWGLIKTRDECMQLSPSTISVMHQKPDIVGGES